MLNPNFWSWYCLKEFLALLLDTLHEELRAEKATQLIGVSSEESGDMGKVKSDIDMSMASKARGRKFSGTVGPTDDKRFVDIATVY